MAGVPTADLRAARRYAPLIEDIASGYRNPLTGQRLSGTALLLKLAKGESNFDPNAKSEAGARGRVQFMPGSRSIAIRKYGVDPLRSVDEAYHGAALHLLGKINGSPGLRGYNPGGGQGYVDYILRQRVGKVSGGGSRSAPQAPSGAPVAAPDAQSAVQAPEGGSANVAALLAALERPQRPAASLPQGPMHSAGPTLPQGYQAPVSAAAPPRRDIAAILDAIRTPGGEVPSGQAGQVPVVAPPGTAAVESPIVAAAFERAVKINGAKLPYKWGGGHGGKVDPNRPVPLDCSGAVSAVLGINPRVSGQFVKWGTAGRDPTGKGITVYANKGHVLMEIGGRFFGTSKTNPGGGAGWIPRKAISPEYLRGFTARHLRAATR